MHGFMDTILLGELRASAAADCMPVASASSSRNSERPSSSLTSTHARAAFV